MIPTLRLATLLLCLSAAAGARAGTPVDQTRPLDPRGKVEIDNLKGRIQVRAWDRPEVHIAGTLGEGVEKLEVEGDARSLEIKVKYPQSRWGGGNSGPSTLEVMVPVRASLEIDSVSAKVDVSGTGGGELQIDTVSGDVVAAAAPSKAQVETVSGTQRLTLNSGEVSSSTVSGDIVLRGRLDGEIKLGTVSGDIDLAVLERRPRQLDTNSVSGDTRVATALATNAEVGMTSVSGDLRLSLPRDVSARVSAESFSGELSAPDAQVKRPAHGPGANLEHTYGNGEAKVRLETFSGDASVQLD
ncbi:MAG: DUF4097 family beta strand repeat-containing protein [Pseudoxanthomonas sp.]